MSARPRRVLAPTLPQRALPTLLSAERAAEAQAAWQSIGLPTRQVEAWKYTQPKGYFDAPLVGAQSASQLGLSLDAAQKAALLESSAQPEATLVFVNGHFEPALSVLPSDGALIVRPFYAADAPHGLGELAPAEGHPFVALNGALAAEGLQIIVPANAQVGPVELRWLTAAEGAEGRVVSTPRLWLSVGKNASLQLIERFGALRAGEALVASVAELRLEDGATMHHSYVGEQGEQTLHYAHNQVQLGRDSRYHSYVILLGGAQVRYEQHTHFGDLGGEATNDTLFAAQNGQQLDVHTETNHVSPRCTSRQLCKGIAAPGGRGVFTGKVQVSVGAHHTSADQHNANLLLNHGGLAGEGSGRIDTRPQLEIDNDDVKCTHGATVGQLDEDARFYLQTRGLPSGVADRLLTAAFAEEVLERLPSERLRDDLRARTLKVLFGEGDHTEWAIDAELGEDLPELDH